MTILVPELHDPYPDHEYRIYGDNNAQTWAIVDEVDYHYFIRWCWCTKSCKARKNYLRRAVNGYSNGVRLRTSTLYLHVEIMKRTGILPPSPFHTIVDHRDGNSFNCLRSNLRWTTPRQNIINRFGKYANGFLQKDFFYTDKERVKS